MKKTFIGALASLMLAGMISAVSGATTNTANGTVIVIGEGSAPVPQAAAPATEPGETSLAK